MTVRTHILPAKPWHEDRENPAVDAFLSDIDDVCRRHGMSISHADGGGEFIVKKYSSALAEWLAAADVDDVP